MPPPFIFSMKQVRKVTSQGKEILKGISLSFYAGAKIGVLCSNGPGKSTLPKITRRARPAAARHVRAIRRDLDNAGRAALRRRDGEDAGRAGTRPGRDRRRRRVGA